MAIDFENVTAEDLDNMSNDELRQFIASKEEKRGFFEHFKDYASAAKDIFDPARAASQLFNMRKKNAEFVSDAIEAGKHPKELGNEVVYGLQDFTAGGLQRVNEVMNALGTPGTAKSGHPAPYVPTPEAYALELQNDRLERDIARDTGPLADNQFAEFAHNVGEYGLTAKLGFSKIPFTKGGGALNRIGAATLTGAAYGAASYITPEELANGVTAYSRAGQAAALAFGFSSALDLGRRMFSDAPFLSQHIAKDLQGKAYKQSSNLAREMNKHVGQSNNIGVSEWIQGKEKASTFGKSKIDFTPAQTSGTGTAINVEQGIRNNAQLGDALDRQNRQNLNGLKRYLDWTRKTFLSPSTTQDKQKLVGELHERYSSRMKAFAKLREQEWNYNWSEVKGAIVEYERKVGAKIAGFKAENAKQSVNQIMDLVRQGSPTMEANLPKGFVRHLAKLQTKLNTPGGRLTIDDYKNYMHLFSNLSESASRAMGSTAGHVAGNAQLQRNAAMMIDAFEKDLTNLSHETGFSKNAAQWLRKARHDWAVSSQGMSSIRATTVGTLLGKKPQEISFTDVSKAFTDPQGDPSQLKMMTKLFDEWDPQLMDQVRADILETATRNSMVQGVLDEKLLHKNLPKGAHLSALMNGNKARRHLIRALAASEMIARRTGGIPYSAGEMQQNIMRTGASVAQQAATGQTPQATFAAGLAAKLRLPKALSKLSTQEGREAMLAIYENKAPSKVIAGYLVLLGDDPEFTNYLDGLAKTDLKYIEKRLGLDKNVNHSGRNARNR